VALSAKRKIATLDADRLNVELLLQVKLLELFQPLARLPYLSQPMRYSCLKRFEKNCAVICLQTRFWATC